MWRCVCYSGILNYILELYVKSNTLSFRHAGKHFGYAFGDTFIRLRFGVITKVVQLKARLQEAREHLPQNCIKVETRVRVNIVANLPHQRATNHPIATVQLSRSRIPLDLSHRGQLQLTGLPFI